MFFHWTLLVLWLKPLSYKESSSWADMTRGSPKLFWLNTLTLCLSLQNLIHLEESKSCVQLFCSSLIYFSSMLLRTEIHRRGSFISPHTGKVTGPQAGAPVHQKHSALACINTTLNAGSSGKSDLCLDSQPHLGKKRSFWYTSPFQN